MPSVFRQLKLERPLAVVDLETTGVDAATTASSRSAS